MTQLRVDLLTNGMYRVMRRGGMIRYYNDETLPDNIKVPLGLMLFGATDESVGKEITSGLRGMFGFTDAMTVLKDPMVDLTTFDEISQSFVLVADKETMMSIYGTEYGIVDHDAGSESQSQG